MRAQAFDRIFVGPAAALLATLCITEGLAQTTAAPPPLEAFAFGTEFLHPDISPDGKHIVYIDLSTRKRVVALLDIDSKKTGAILGGEIDDFVVDYCHFKNDTRLLCHYHATVAELGVNYVVSRLLAVNTDRSEVKVLVQRGATGDAQFQDRVVDMLHGDPRNVLIQVDDNKDIFPTVFKLDIYTGRMTTVQRDSPPVTDWSTDRDGVVRFAFGYRDGKGVYRTRDNAESPWRVLLRFDVFDGGDFQVFGFGAQSDKLIVSSPKDGRDAIWEMDLNDQSDRQLLFANSKVDVDGPVYWPSDDRLVGFRYETEKSHLKLFDPAAAAVQANIDRLLPDAINRVVGASRDNQRMIVSSVRDVSPLQYYLLDYGAGKLALLHRNSPLLKPEMLSAMQPIEVPAADGVTVPGYLTLPVGKTPKNLPTVVLPHGGPYARDSWEYDELVQVLASRGYAVLQLNFRGSTGYGSAWHDAGYQKWGTVMHEDITAGTRWLQAQGIADPKRTCLVGWSYGGYAALMGGIKESGLYQCIVSIAGVTDMKNLIWDRRGFYEGRRSVEASTGKDDLDANSPLKHADQLKLPVLLVHGTRDSVVEFDHSKQMARALARAGNEPKLVLIEDGDHSLIKPQMRLQLYRELEQFLAKYLHP